MKCRTIVPAVLGVGVLYLAVASSAQAFELLERVLNLGGPAAVQKDGGAAQKDCGAKQKDCGAKQKDCGAKQKDCGAKQK
ncbi:MAG: hypothetical protein ACC628_27610, partial [Pirellulaceae bacterium]